MTALSTGLRLAVVALGIWLCQAASAAVTFTNTPTAVSNQYNGAVTLQINGVMSGETVLIQQYVDANTNNVVDSADTLVQQFQITDGQLPARIGGVTNVNIPYDLNSATGAITAQVNLRNSGIAELLVGKFLYVLTSSGGRFTNQFSVTNSPYAQSFIGRTVSGGTNVPYAQVYATDPYGDGFNPVAGIISDASGSYNLKIAAGTYRMAAFKTGFIADLSASPIVALGNGSTSSNNLTLIPATQTISGKMVDATNSNLGLPAVLFGTQYRNSNGVAAGFGLSATGTNGAFSLLVTSNKWGIGVDESTLSFHGYVGLNNSGQADTTTGSVAGVTISFPQATALFYGSVKDGQGNPLPGVRVYGDNGSNGNGQYQGAAGADPNGNYAMGVVAGAWGIDIDQRPTAEAGYGSYVFSASSVTYNNGGPGTNLVAGMTVRQDFTGLLGTNHISGYIRNSGGMGIGGVGINANATISGTNYQIVKADSDTNGNYSFNVPNGNWNINLNCCNDCNDGLPSIYQCPNNTNVNINNNNGVANFVVQSAGPSQINGYVRDNSNNAIGNVGVYVYPLSCGSGCSLYGSTDSSGYYQFSVTNGSWGVGVSCCCDNFSLNGRGYICVSDQTTSVNNSTGNVNFTVQPGHQITGYVLNVGSNAIPNVQVYAYETNGGNYVSTDTDNNGYYTISGLSNTTWYVGVDCAGLNSLGYDCPPEQPVTIFNANGMANFIATGGLLQITNVSLPNGTQGLFYATSFGATGGLPPYTWTLSPGSAPLPPNLALATNGLLSGKPTASGTSYFWVRVTDATPQSLDQLFSITVIGSTNNPGVLITSPKHLTNGGFQFTINTAAGVNYTVQTSPDLKSWNSGDSFSGSGGPLTITDLATGSANPRFYRVKVGP